MCTILLLLWCLLRVKEASQCFPPESLEADADHLTDYRYNFSRQERALRSINFHRGDVSNFSCLHLENLHVSDKRVICC